MIEQDLGPYRLESKLGEGGMGEVYLARDADLNRSVAIKVLPAEVTSDAHRVARFEQEARASAEHVVLPLRSVSGSVWILEGVER